MKKVSYSFQYENKTSENVDVWLANPPKTGEQNIISEEKRSPVQEYEDAIGNRISYYELASGEKIEASYNIELQRNTSTTSSLTDDERERFMRSTSMIPINDEIQQLAFQVTHETDGPRDQAWSLFQYIIKNYTYKFPVQTRGIDHFLQTKKGDCGEFSFLYAALCRALGIPCRVMVGAFVMGKHDAHVWNEVYLENEGWIPVDTSMAYTVRRQLWRFFFSSIPTLRWRQYFGQTENQRIVFSIDTEHVPSPPYPEAKESMDPYQTFPLAGQSFAWGKSSLQGAIPYFQPMYFFYHADEPYKLKRTEEALGSWEVKEAGDRRGLLEGRRISGYAALFLAFLSLFTSWEFASILFPFPAFFYCLSFLLRKERPVFFSIATGIFGIIGLLVILGFIAEVI